MSNEEQRYSQLLNFMTSFKTSMECNMKVTNEKLDRRMSEITEEVREVKMTIGDNEKIADERMKRMDERLDKLETEMTKAEEEKKKRRDILLRQKDKQMITVEEQTDKDPLENSTKKTRKTMKIFNRRRIETEDLIAGEEVLERQTSYKSTGLKTSRTSSDELQDLEKSKKMTEERRRRRTKKTTNLLQRTGGMKEETMK